MQQAEMECYKVKGTAHGASHSRAVAEEQQRHAQQDLGASGEISAKSGRTIETSADLCY